MKNKFWFDINISWKKYLYSEFQKSYFLSIINFLDNEYKLWKVIYPNKENIFRIFKETSFEDIKVVIIWQDPYHGKNQANWLCFSVDKWITIPPSLRNIYRELESDIWVIRNNNNSLDAWCKKWIFLLNSVLTVEEWIPASHSNIWWIEFTDFVIKLISDNKIWVVFMLWWNYAKTKKSQIDTSRHFIIESTHPSPFSANKWFLWSKPFSKSNSILLENWFNFVDWSLD